METVLTSLSQYLLQSAKILLHICIHVKLLRKYPSVKPQAGLTEGSFIFDSIGSKFTYLMFERFKTGERLFYNGV